MFLNVASVSATQQQLMDIFPLSDGDFCDFGEIGLLIVSPEHHHDV